jgi:hypothetical protein
VENVLRAINTSEIEFIQRLDQSAKLNLARRIYSIPQVQTLYGTQLLYMFIFMYLYLYVYVCMYVCM